MQFKCGVCGCVIKEPNVNLHECFKDVIYVESENSYLYPMKAGEDYSRKLLFQIRDFPVPTMSQSSAGLSTSETESSVAEPFATTEGSVPHDVATTLISISEAIPENTFKWTHPTILLLLNSFQIHYKKYQDRHIQTKKQMHKNICEDMLQHGYIVSIEKVENKLKRLIDNYKERIDNKGPKQSGRSRKEFPYFE